ncbi:MAG: hypothetical protein V1816_16915 [Pseudomonadota bacterium]
MKAKELAFMGKITAGTTHEMNNVLATIRESGGLLQDLMGLAKDQPFPYRDKFLKVLSNIDDQVKRGVELAGKLNKFAHSMDNPHTRMDALTLLQLNIFLMHRFARLKQVELALAPSSANIEVALNPFLVLLTLSSAIDLCLADSAAGGAIALSCGQDERGVFFEAAYMGSRSGDQAAPPAGLEPILAELGGSLEAQAEPGRLAFRLRLNPAR